jgi:hypothetical protein
LWIFWICPNVIGIWAHESSIPVAVKPRHRIIEFRVGLQRITPVIGGEALVIGRGGAERPGFAIGKHSIIFAHIA